MEKVIIEKLYKNDKDFNGNPYINKFTNQPEVRYTMVAGDRKFKLYGPKAKLEELKEGDTIEGTAEKKEYQGHEYYTFTLPKPVDPVVQGILDRLEALEHAVYDKATPDYDEIEPEDIPFD